MPTATIVPRREQNGRHDAPRTACPETANSRRANRRIADIIEDARAAGWRRPMEKPASTPMQTGSPAQVDAPMWFMYGCTAAALKAIRVHKDRKVIAVPPPVVRRWTRQGEAVGANCFWPLAVQCRWRPAENRLASGDAAGPRPIRSSGRRTRGKGTRLHRSSQARLSETGWLSSRRLLTTQNEASPMAPAHIAVKEAR